MTSPIQPDLCEMADRLERLVIMDEVSSDNPLGRDAAAALRHAATLQAQLTQVTEALRQAGDHINGLRDEWSERDTANDPYPDYIREALAAPQGGEPRKSATSGE